MDGTNFPADVLLTRMSLNGPEVLHATVRDITQQKENEERLKQAEEKHRTLLNAANVLVQSIDAEGKYVFVNDEWKKVLGYTDQDLQNINMM
jgi:PAS domain-containing protein